jgi:hypothetical protein
MRSAAGATGCASSSPPEGRRLHSVPHPAAGVCPVVESACVAVRMGKEEVFVGVCILTCGGQFRVCVAWSYLPVAPTNQPIQTYIHRRCCNLCGMSRAASTAPPHTNTHTGASCSRMTYLPTRRRRCRHHVLAVSEPVRKAAQLLQPIDGHATCVLSSG